VKGLQMTTTNIAKQGHAWQFKEGMNNIFLFKKIYLFLKGQFQVAILKLIDS
jgi:hypothetical protein